MSNSVALDYSVAFSRNLGWVTKDEQARLRNARVTIAGLGGGGGVHLLTLGRLGIARFNLADFDHFEGHDFNRQAGATLASVGQPTVDLLARMALDIKPEADIELFREDVTAQDVDGFLRGVDLYADGIYFFALQARRMVVAACRKRGIPAVTAAPMGMVVSLLYFDPEGMSFEDYFRFEGLDAQEQYARFIAGLSPAMLQRNYLVAP